MFRDFLLESIHPLAFKAAEAAEGAGEQGKYWEMHKLIFARQDHLDDPALLARAKDLKLDEAAFRTCLSGKTVSKIKGDQSEGTRLGIRSTPTFFVGVTLPNGRIKLMRRIDGAAPYESLKNAIDDVAVDAKGVS